MVQYHQSQQEEKLGVTATSAGNLKKPFKKPVRLAVCDFERGFDNSMRHGRGECLHGQTRDLPGLEAAIKGCLERNELVTDGLIYPSCCSIVLTADKGFPQFSAVNHLAYHCQFSAMVVWDPWAHALCNQ